MLAWKSQSLSVSPALTTRPPGRAGSDIPASFGLCRLGRKLSQLLRGQHEPEALGKVLAPGGEVRG